MSKDIFDYNRVLKPICRLITNHRHRKIISCTEDFIRRGYRAPHRSDFYYKCKVCGWVFFNNCPTEEEIKQIKEWEKERL